MYKLKFNNLYEARDWMVNNKQHIYTYCYVLGDEQNPNEDLEIHMTFKDEKEKETYALFRDYDIHSISESKSQLKENFSDFFFRALTNLNAKTIEKTILDGITIQQYDEDRMGCSKIKKALDALCRQKGEQMVECIEVLAKYGVDFHVEYDLSEQEHMTQFQFNGHDSEEQMLAAMAEKQNKKAYEKIFASFAPQEKSPQLHVQYDTPAKPHTTRRDAGYLMHLLIFERNTEAVRAICKYEPRVYKPDCASRPPLLLAILLQEWEMVSIIKEATHVEQYTAKHQIAIQEALLSHFTQYLKGKSITA